MKFIKERLVTALPERSWSMAFKDKLSYSQQSLLNNLGEIETFMRKKSTLFPSTIYHWSD